MKYAIVYASKGGTVKKCASIIAEKLEGADIYDCLNNVPDLSGYGMIIIGGAYYAGRFPAPLRRFIKKNAELLESHPYALYACCLDTAHYGETLMKNVGKERMEGAVVLGFFGGEVEGTGSKGLTKLFFNAMAKGYASRGEPLPKIKTEAIDVFTAKVKAAAEKQVK